MSSTPRLGRIVSQCSLPWRPCLPGPAPRLLSGVGRAAVVCVLVPVVVLIGLGTLAGLVMLSTVRLLRPRRSSLRTAAARAGGREVHLYPRRVSEATDTGTAPHAA
jgi:hypothetical protein